MRLIHEPAAAVPLTMTHDVRPPLQAITFDLDNTLWQSGPVLRKAEAAQNAWLSLYRPRVMAQFSTSEVLALRRSLCQREPALVHNITRLRWTVLYEMQRTAGYDESEARTGAEQAFARFHAARHDVQLHAAALPVLATLSSRYTLGALTNGNADVYRTPAGPYFAFAYRAEQVGANKPAAPLFGAALRHTGLPAACVLHVGDSLEHDVLGALGVGMRALWLRPEGDDEVPPVAVDGVIRDLSELPDAIARITEAR